MANDEVLKNINIAIVLEEAGSCGCDSEVGYVCERCFVIDTLETAKRLLTKRAADETYCGCKDEAFINDDTPGKCGNCGKPFRR